MMDKGFNLGIRRKKIEDRIIAQYQAVNFKQRDHAWVEDERFWDYVFAWHELVKYYEDTDDTTVGVVMLELYQASIALLHSVATDKKIKERRRDRAAEGIRQMNYWLEDITHHVQHNALPPDDDAVGRIAWN